MKWMVIILAVLINLQVDAQQTFRVGGEILNTDTFTIRVYAHSIGLIHTERTPDKVWSLKLGEYDNYIIEFENDKTLKVANLIGFKGQIYDLTLDVDFNNRTDVVIIKPNEKRNNVEITYRGRQLFIRRF